MERARAMLADLRRTLEQTIPVDDATGTATSWRRDHSVWRELARLAGLDDSPVSELLPPKPEAAERFPVGDFEAKDLSGKMWRLSDLKGKVAYVNVWTTWCVPCRAEMPGLQKLHDRWKNIKDRVVLTISADVHEALARDFIREHKYTFPVVHGTAVAGKFFPPISFPQNWLIDPEGRRLSIHAPRAYDSTIAQIEDLADKLAVPASR
jgi:thiol-disulfide isomerase/thioredoxin